MNSKRISITIQLAVQFRYACGTLSHRHLSSLYLPQCAAIIHVFMRDKGCTFLGYLSILTYESIGRLSSGSDCRSEVLSGRLALAINQLIGLWSMEEIVPLRLNLYPLLVY